MSETLSIMLVFALLVTAIPSLALVVVLWLHLKSMMAAASQMAVLTERAMDLLAARSSEDFLRARTSPSTSLLYPPSDEPDLGQLGPKEDDVDDAYQAAINLGVPDDVAQYLEE